MTRCLGADFSKIWGTIHHEIVSRKQSSGVSISGPIYIHPAPQNIKVFVRVTRVPNRLISSTAKVKQTVLSGKHVVFHGNCTYVLSSEYAQARSQAGRVIVTRYLRLPTMPW